MTAGSYTPFRWIYGTSIQADAGAGAGTAPECGSVAGQQGAIFNFAFTGSVSTPIMESIVCPGDAPAFPSTT